MIQRRQLALAALLGSLTSPLLAKVVGKPKVLIQTNMGDMVVQLDDTRAPISVENFLRYVKEGFYDGTIFHRVIPGFMIQGCGFTPDMQQKPTQAPIQNESTNGLKNAVYTLAMARTTDPNSATSQFFINVADNDFLDRSNAADGVGYAVFGRVIKGQNIAEKIATVPTRTVGYFGDVPVKPVVIEKITLL